MTVDGIFTVVPVLADFAQSEQIGELRILTSYLPPTAEFCFALGIRAEEEGALPGLVPSTVYKGPFTLFAIAPVLDTNYVEYLRQVGVVPPLPSVTVSTDAAVTVPVTGPNGRRDDGGSAYPEIFTEHREQQNGPSLMDIYSAGGMTVRQRVAMAVLQSLCAKEGSEEKVMRDLLNIAYTAADLFILRGKS